MISLKVLSKVSKQNLCAIGVSSQMIIFVIFNNSASSDPCWMLHVEFCNIGTRMTNLECAVLPPSNSKEVIPLEATIRTIFPLECKQEANVFHMNFFRCHHSHKENMNRHIDY
ncbi:hypothetical protein GLYMA_17G168700v4 [Glycine max]|uniref:Uncharacterized protein n=1 Tax=Glycine max TaxID=3847 RepID=A0A0R0FPH0_SOYBN|nr:hypothetical protein JHK86_047654 [Glycine max]KAG4943625.1 hypothetical protein JHK85_048271 [Glycine max]KAG5102711.1 hypothetical protein JHK84_047680 [Glycine max]KAH1118792.1 hypothetical protein GYH30_047539 [Glycine max]KRH04543.1 hypothetical protein GLYMA_17G168700v4 [Glycine max]